MASSNQPPGELSALDPISKSVAGSNTKMSKQGSPSKSTMGSPNRRIIDELRTNHREILKDIEHYNTRKINLEKEITTISMSEEERYHAFYDMEKENKRLKNELSLIVEEQDMFGKKQIDHSYGDFVKGLK